MKEAIITGIFTISAAAVGGIITLLGTRNKNKERQLQNNIQKLRRELLSAYKDMLELWKSENELIELSAISKKEARKDRNISKSSEPARIKNRIKTLEGQLYENRQDSAS